MAVNSFVDHLIAGKFPKFRNWARLKYNSVIQFKEFPKILEKIELHDL